MQYTKIKALKRVKNSKEVSCECLNSNQLKLQYKGKNAPSLDTLAQLGTSGRNVNDSNLQILDKNYPSTGDSPQDFTLNKTTKATDKSALYKRAKRKYLQVPLTLALVDHVAKLEADHYENGTGEVTEEGERLTANLKSFWNMYHCANAVKVDLGNASAKYCKNKLCIICNSIRTAVMIGAYEPVFETWKDSHFVTLTIPNIPADKLSGSIDEMEAIFTRIKNKIRQREKRSKTAKEDKFKGVRKLECTYNPHTNDYHPHYHLIIATKEHAEYVRTEWLERTSHLGTTAKAQDVRKVHKGRKGKSAELELFKYFTKIVTDAPQDKNKPYATKQKLIYIEAVYTIFNAFRGRRNFQNFGFKLKDYAKEVEEQETVDISDLEDKNPLPSGLYVWRQKVGDWCNLEDKTKVLAKHKPSDKLKEITKTIVRPKYLNKLE